MLLMVLGQGVNTGHRFPFSQSFFPWGQGMERECKEEVDTL